MSSSFQPGTSAKVTGISFTNALAVAGGAPVIGGCGMPLVLAGGAVPVGGTATPLDGVVVLEPLGVVALPFGVVPVLGTESAAVAAPGCALLGNVVVDVAPPLVLGAGTLPLVEPAFVGAAIALELLVVVFAVAAPGGTVLSVVLTSRVVEQATNAVIENNDTITHWHKRAVQLDCMSHTFWNRSRRTSAAHVTYGMDIVGSDSGAWHRDIYRVVDLAKEAAAG